MTIVPEISHFTNRDRREPINKEAIGSECSVKKRGSSSNFEVKIIPTDPAQPFIDPYVTNTAFGVRGYPGYKKKYISLEAYMRKISKLELQANHIYLI